MSKVIDCLQNKLEGSVKLLGYEIEYIECVQENKNNILRVVIDKEGVITTEDCEKVSREIEDIVDSIVTYKEGYILEVSSPGIERKLLSTRLYQKYIGSKVRIKLYKSKDGTKELLGILVKANDTEIVINCDNKEIALVYTEIAQASTVCEM